MKTLTKLSKKKVQKPVNETVFQRALETLMKRHYAYCLSMNIKRGIVLKKKRLQAQKF